MLLSLIVRDFVIVDRLELEFGKGFGALTGETGAGKSTAEGHDARWPDHGVVELIGNPLRIRWDAWDAGETGRVSVGRCDVRPRSISERGGGGGQRHDHCGE